MTDMEHSVSRETRVEAQVEQALAGRRKRVYHGGSLCSRCYAEPQRPGQRYGKRCHAAYEADRRKKHLEELKRLRGEHDHG